MSDIAELRKELRKLIRDARKDGIVNASITLKMTEAEALLDRVEAAEMKLAGAETREMLYRERAEKAERRIDEVATKLKRAAEEAFQLPPMEGVDPNDCAHLAAQLRGKEDR